MPTLTQAEARRLTEQGGTCVCTGLPEGAGACAAPRRHSRLRSVVLSRAEFGIGVRTYGIGPNFRGVKMIPPGIHLVTYGTGIDRVGVFLRFAPGDVHVRRPAACAVPRSARDRHLLRRR